jgi:Arc/MetJ-type ribon-helix-helix transcriptional regulator
MTTSRPERPFLPAQKVGAPNSSLRAGQIIWERWAREIKTKSAGKRRTKIITIRLPAVLVEAIDELLRFGPYTNRTEVIRSILAQELPRHLGRYQATYQDTDEKLPTCDDGSKRKNVSVYMTKRMFANLLTMAEMLEVSKSELIRMAVDHFFREYGEVYRK